MKGRINKDGFEQSQLTVQEDADRTVIHRDYLAHVYRWQHTLKWLAASKRYETTNVLDVGSGYDIPLYVALHSNRRIPNHYIGVDVGKIREPVKKYRGARTLMSHTDICSYTPHLPINLVVSFEMLEHVPFEYAQKTVKHVYDVSTDDATFIMSTPVFDEKVGMASNHINEMTREQVKSILQDAGWLIQKNYGTFASIKDYKQHLSVPEFELFNKLSEYYHSDVLSTIFAPLYPEYSRNNLWVCTK